MILVDAVVHQCGKPGHVLKGGLFAIQRIPCQQLQEKKLGGCRERTIWHLPTSTRAQMQFRSDLQRHQWLDNLAEGQGYIGVGIALRKLALPSFVVASYKTKVAELFYHIRKNAVGLRSNSATIIVQSTRHHKKNQLELIHRQSE